jgi:CheY-like chemotaxis protein
MRLPLILYIEDSGFYQKMLLDIIGADYELHFADTAFLGIVKALSLLPDIIFLDVQLPDARGPELIKTIKRYMPKSIIIMVTSDNSAQTVSESKELGANGYIIKPFSVAQINKHLDKWQVEFNKSSRMVSTPEIASKLAELIKEKEELKSVEKIKKYQLWMEKKLPITLPFVFLEVIDLPVIYNKSKQMCTTVLAFTLEFNGELSCIGFWNELKTKSTVTPYLMKSVIKSLKSRELNDIYALVLDPQIRDFIPEFQSSYPNAIVGQRLIPYHNIFYTQDFEIKK